MESSFRPDEFWENKFGQKENREKKENDLALEMVSSLLDKEGFVSILKVLSEATSLPSFLINKKGNIITYYYPQNSLICLEENEILRQKTLGIEEEEILEPSLQLQKSRVKGEEDTKLYPCLSLSLKKDYFEGYLLILWPSKEVDLPTVNILKWAYLCLLLEISKERELNDLEQKYKDEFIQDILFNNITSLDVLISQGKKFGLNFNKPYALMVIEPDEIGTGPEDECRFQAFFGEVKNIVLSCEPSAIISNRGSQIIIMVPANLFPAGYHKKTINKILKNLKQEVDLSQSGNFSAGVGRMYESSLDLFKSYQEAKTALNIGRLIGRRGQLTDFDELGVIRLIYNVSPQEIEDFVEETIGKLITYDEINQTNLLVTLNAYLQSNKNPRLTAQLIFAHPNTIRYRIAKVEEILGISLEQIEDCVNLYIAIQLKNTYHIR